ncbi:hypothetical protein D3C85_681260 [compost metagenome]
MLFAHHHLQQRQLPFPLPQGLVHLFEQGQGQTLESDGRRILRRLTEIMAGGALEVTGDRGERHRRPVANVNLVC